MNAQLESLSSASSAIMAKESSEKLVPAMVVAAEFGIVRRTLARWLGYSDLNFPKPNVINGRWYFRRAEIEAWKLERARLSVLEAV
jgi:predicted DNA-binding transcriptional regulator AlpA